MKLVMIDQDREFYENEATKINDDEDRYVEDFLVTYREGEAPDEELKDVEVKEARLTFIAK